MFTSFASPFGVCSLPLINFAHEPAIHQHLLNRSYTSEQASCTYPNLMLASFAYYQPCSKRLAVSKSHPCSFHLTHLSAYHSDGPAQAWTRGDGVLGAACPRTELTDQATEFLGVCQPDAIHLYFWEGYED